MEEEWRDRAREEQASYAREDPWTCIAPGDWLSLRKIVGSVRFGPPMELPSEANEQTGFSRAKLSAINRTCNLLTESFGFEDRGISISVIYIIARVDDESSTFPIFKSKAVNSEPKSCIFVDTWDRRYKSWEDYLRAKKLPASTYCAPVDGLYAVDENGDLKLTFEQSEAMNLTAKASNAIGIAALAILAVGPAVPDGCQALPEAMVATATRVLTNTALGVADRMKHGQGLFDYKAITKWFSNSREPPRTADCSGRTYDEHDPLEVSRRRTLNDLFPGLTDETRREG